MVWVMVFRLLFDIFIDFLFYFRLVFSFDFRISASFHFQHPFPFAIPFPSPFGQCTPRKNRKKLSKHDVDFSFCADSCVCIWSPLCIDPSFDCSSPKRRKKVKIERKASRRSSLAGAKPLKMLSFKICKNTIHEVNGLFICCSRQKSKRSTTPNS